MDHRHRSKSAPSRPAEVARPRVLLVMPGVGHRPLLGGLAALGIEVVRVHNCSQARWILEACPDIRAVLTELELPDGSWRAVADAVAAHCVNTEVVVLARSITGKLRRQVLEGAVYDLLVEPYSQGEVGRVVGGAVLTSYRRYIGISELAPCNQN